MSDVEVIHDVNPSPKRIKMSVEVDNGEQSAASEVQSQVPILIDDISSDDDSDREEEVKKNVRQMHGAGIRHYLDDVVEISDSEDDEEKDVKPKQPHILVHPNPVQKQESESSEGSSVSETSSDKGGESDSDDEYDEDSDDDGVYYPGVADAAIQVDPSHFYGGHLVLPLPPRITGTATVNIYQNGVLVKNTSILYPPASPSSSDVEEEPVTGP